MKITSYRSQRGFSLIELMIVIMIIGVLTGIAIPAYKEYIVKAKVTELMALVQPAKLAVVEAFIFDTPIEDINHTKLGLATFTNKGKVLNMSVTRGVITLNVNHEKLGVKLPNNQAFKITFSPRIEEGFIEWDCLVEPNEFRKFMPSSCKKMPEVLE